MKKIVTTTIATSSLLMSALSYADFNLTTQASCPDLSGRWKGVGHASNFLVDCYYQGNGDVTMIDDNHFVFFLSVDKNKGSFICPTHHEETFSGTCENATITVSSNYGTLSGTVNKNQGHASGKLKIVSGIKVDVEIDVTR